MTKETFFHKGYSEVDGLSMYYEIHGDGLPIVLIHGGGSTIETSFGTIIPLLAKKRQVVAVEMQAHGRTGDRNSFLSFEQDADDVAQLLENLQIEKADILGFSNGGHTAIEIALRHPYIVNKLILCSTFYRRSATVPEFWKGFDTAQFDTNMPQLYKDAFLKVNSNREALLNMFDKDVQRMKNFKDWTDEQMQSIKAPTLVVSGTADVGSPEHAVEMFRIIPNSELAILPGGHGAYLGEIFASKDNKAIEYFVPLLEEFLEK